MNEVAPIPGAEPVGLLNWIARAATDPAIDVAKLEALLQMQRQVAREVAQTAFNAAMAAAQAEMQPVVRDADNPHFRSKYARLETIDAAIRPIYTKHGFSVRYGSAAPEGGGIRITCTVAHRDGYFEEHYLDAPIDVTGARGGPARTPVQGVGSTVSYLRRYLLCMVFHITVADEDDDGEGSRPPRRQTIREWLNGLYAELARCRSIEDVDMVVTRPEVQQAMENFVNGAREQLSEMVAGAYARVRGDE